MKIDFSSILLLLLCVIPGLFAQRSRDLVCPRSFASQGATAEAGELVALGVSTHGVLICLVAFGLALLGLLLNPHEVSHYFSSLDRLSLETWASNHRSEALVIATLYVFASFGVSHWLGIAYGIWRFKSPVTDAALRRTVFLKRLGIQGLQGERPLVYEAFKPDVRQKDGVTNLVFLEVEMKGGGGFYSGQLSKFSLVKDEEPHKFIHLIAPIFKATREVQYSEIKCDGVLLDLAEAISVRVIQTPEFDDTNPNDIAAITTEGG